MERHSQMIFFSGGGSQEFQAVILFKLRLAMVAFEIEMRRAKQRQPKAAGSFAFLVIPNSSFAYSSL